MSRKIADPNFDRVAHIYRWMEYATFGRSLQACRRRYLPQLQNCRSALILGDGDGRFLAHLLAANPCLHADAVDTSRAMLHLLKRRAEAASQDAPARLTTHLANAIAFAPLRSYDLVAAHFFLDCLSQTQLQSLIARLVTHIKPGGLFVLSEFRIPGGAMALPSRFIVRMLYLAFRLLTGLPTRRLPDHATALNSAGFTRNYRHLSLCGLLTSELWQLREYTPAMLPPQNPRTPPAPDPLPDPEPASPSLPEPDPGVFHREPSAPLREASCPTEEE
jgi:SAM-dependent methyltransferase